MKKKHSMWSGRYLVVIIAASILSAVMALRTTCMSVFVTSMAEGFNTTTAAVLTYSSIMSLTALVATPVWGKLLAKIGLVKCVLISGALTSISLVAWAYSPNLFSMYIFAGIMGVFTSGCGVLPASVAVTMWFEEKRGTVMGIVIAFLSVGGVLGSALLPGVIVSSGWSQALLYIAIATCIGTVPIAFLLKPPAAYGLAPLGHVDAPATAGADPAAPVELPGIPAAKAMRMPLFYILWVGMMFVNLPSSFMANMATWGVLKGFDLAASGMLISYCCLAGIVFTILVGICNDKFGSKQTTIIYLGIGIVGFVGFIFANSYGLAIVVSVLIAIGYSYLVAMPAIICALVFGPRDYGQLYANLSIAATVAGIIGAPGIALLQNTTGSYNLSLILLSAFWACSIVIVLYCLKKGTEIQATITAK